MIAISTGGLLLATLAALVVAVGFTYWFNKEEEGRL